MAEADSDKTEEATPERRRKAREEGQFPRARDAGPTLASLFVLVTLSGTLPGVIDVLRAFSHRCFSEPFSLTSGDPAAVFKSVAPVLGLLTFPALLAATVGATIAGLAEAGFHPQFALAFPKWTRLDPLPKLSNMFSPKEAATNVALQSARVATVAVVAYLSIKETFPEVIRLSRAALSGAAVEAGKALFELAMWASVALLGLVVVDYLVSRKRHEGQLRMTRHEVKEELRQHEGDPRVRARQRLRARELLRKGLARAVKESDFVVVNPTHVSVAMRYRPEEGAPIVSAKGYDEVAAYIRRLATQNGLPIVENVALARELASRVKVGRTIPVDLYAAVAEVLAFVYRLKNRRPVLSTG